MRRLLPTLLFALLLLSGQSAGAADGPTLVIYDNDFFGAASDDILPLLADPAVTVLGFTMVSGDSWRDEGAATLLRSLEIYRRGEIPVYLGAVYPLVNRPARMRAWEGLYGKLAWKGAWNDAAPGQPWHPDDPALIPPLAEGPPQLKPATAIAVDRSIITRQVTASMDVEIDHGLHYGTTHVWPAALAPHLGEQPVNIVLAVDQPRFFRDYIAPVQSETAYGR
jgi:inosine-uridine nucleoside N-ribohydrolase